MDILLDAIKDTYFIFPILLIMYFALEYFEHRNENKSYETYFTKYGPMCGALLGIIPQCGFSVMASLLFIEGKVTLGTLISVFIATSDEAIPLLMTNPEMYSSLLGMLLCKFVLAILIGYVVDFLFKEKYYQHTVIQKQHHHNHNVFIEALHRTIKIYVFIFLVNVVLSYFIDTIGDDTLSKILMSHSLFQPIISALFGFIPNCAASVILTQLYMHTALSFASLIAGLITNAGLGIIILLQNHVQSKVILKICFILLMTAFIVGLPLQWLHIAIH